MLNALGKGVAGVEEAQAARALWARLRESLGEAIEHQAAMRRHHLYPHGPNLIDVLEARGRRYGTILEIGTAQAVSTVLLAQFCDSVITVDVARMPLTDRVVAESGMAGKVELRLVADNAAKAAVVDGLKFDMAFIDGDHHAAEFKIDFDLTKRCGLLLCHDYPTWRADTEGPGKILDAQAEGVLEVHSPFVWWVKK